MDEREPDIEGLLRRTGHEPASTPGARAIMRRARRRTVALRTLAATATVGVVAAAAVAVAGLLPTEGTDVVLEGASPSPSPEPTVEPSPTAIPTLEPAAPPERWVGLREAGAELEVVLHEPGEERTLARHPRTDPEAGDTHATDVVLDERDGTVLVGLCCEPVSGSFFAAGLDGEGGTLEPRTIQGFRADLHADGMLFARTDTFGILGVQPAFPTVDDQQIWEGAAAADVAVEPGAGARVAALVDPELAAMPVPEHDDRGVLVLERGEDGAWDEEFLPLPERACGLVFLSGDRVGLLHASGDGGEPGDVLRCTGERIDVVDLGTGEVDEGAIMFTEPIGHVRADASGEHVIATAASGRVHWATLDGAGGQLADGGYVAADW